MAYASHSNNATGSRYSSYKGECLVGVWAIAHFKCYLFGTHVVHRPRIANLDAYGLSRNPCISQEDNTRARWHGEVDEEMVPG